MFRVWHIFRRRTASLAHDDHGAVLMITLSVFLLLFILISGVYAVGETVHQKIQLQNAADAAAYSAAMVQADALSRMAVVNRAMSWTYVQMTKRQMDYITYRWLVLTEKHYREDRENAQRWHSFLPIVHVWSYYIPWVFNIMDNYHFPGLLGKFLEALSIKNCESNHNRLGAGWWAGQDMNNLDVLTINDRDVTWKELMEIINSVSPTFDETQITLTEDSVSGTSAKNLTVLSSGSGQTEEERRTQEFIQEGHPKPNRDDFSSETDYDNALDAWENEYCVWENIRYPDPALQQQNEQRYIDAGHPKPVQGNYYTIDPNDGSRIPDEDAYNQALQTWQNNCNDWLNNNTQLGNTAPPGYNPLTGNSPASSSQTNNPSGSSGSSAAPTYSSSGYPAVSEWGKNLAKLIDADKENIKLLSGILGVISANAGEAMKFAAQTALIRNLPTGKRGSDGRYLLDNDKLEEFVYTIRLPAMLDPYDFQNNVGTNIFSPLYNTEADERKFLSMGDDDPSRKRLPEYFGLSGDSPLKTGGFDQWFIRGGVDASGNGSRAADGGEGSQGIQRVYKSANENETDQGLLWKPFARGNHIVHLTGECTKDQFTSAISGKLAGCFGSSGDESTQFVNKIIKDKFVGDDQNPGLIGKLVSGVVDSLFNALNDLVDCTPSVGNSPESNDFMCKSVAESRALFSQYRWASAKWYCIFKPSVSFKHLKPRIKKKWESHIGIPKFYCGNGKCFPDGDFPLEGILAPLLDFFPLPPLKEDYMSPSHGYGKTGWDFKNVTQPYLKLFSQKGLSREDYRCCAIGFDPLDNDKIFLHGHARIYGDDNEIYNERYVGAKARPWVLNENYFNGRGNIIVHVGRKHRNPFAAWWGEEGLTKFFSPPEKNYIWSVSAARAGVRRMRKKDDRGNSPGPFDYSVVYDGSLEKEPKGNLKPKDSDQENNSGCVCHADNQAAYAENWNLCETDWSAVLIPVRYARSSITSDPNASGKPMWELNTAEDENPLSLLFSEVVSLSPSPQNPVGLLLNPVNALPGGLGNSVDMKSLSNYKIY